MGEVVDNETLQPVMFATVLVINRNKGVATSEDGTFEFSVQLNDSIKITSIGYEPVSFLITEALMKNYPDGLFIRLKAGTYLLDSVVVTDYSEDFYLRNLNV